MKKGLFITSMVAASALMLAGCAKSISFEEAKKHCDEHFTSTEIKTFNVHEVSNVTKAEGLFEEIGTGVEEKDYSQQVGVATSDQIATYFGEKASYKVDGTKLIADLKLTAEDIKDTFGFPDAANVTGSGEMHAETDDLGYVTKTWQKLDISVSYSNGGISFSGAYAFEDTATFTVAK